MIKNPNNKYYYIKAKAKSKLNILEATQNDDIILGNTPKEDIKESMEWDLIEIKNNLYVIKNRKNKKFLEINKNNELQCINNKCRKKFKIIYYKSTIYF